VRRRIRLRTLRRRVAAARALRLIMDDEPEVGQTLADMLAAQGSPATS